ncbi:MAG: hypothetical protein ABMA25_06530 [Ilumatobacteraceae bacterium]
MITAAAGFVVVGGAELVVAGVDDVDELDDDETTDVPADALDAAS